MSISCALVLDLCFNRWTRAEWKIVSNFRFYIPWLSVQKNGTVVVVVVVVVVFRSSRDTVVENLLGELNWIEWDTHTHTLTYSKIYKRARFHTCKQCTMLLEMLGICVSVSVSGIVGFSRGKSLNHALLLIFLLLLLLYSMQPTLC